MKMILSLLVAILIASLSPAARAANLPIFGTGLNNSGTLLAGGDVDPHYSLVSFPGQVNGFPAVTYAVAGDLNQYNQTGTTSRWSSWSSVWENATPAGQWTYRTTFDLTGFNPSSASLSGRFMGDDGVTIYLNNVNTGITSGSATVYTSFLFSMGFVNGVNTLDFHVSNANFVAFNPSALRVDGMTLTAVPEPGSLLLLIGAASYLVMRGPATRTK